MIFLTITFLGCNDPVVSEVEARNREFKFILEQELQRNRNASKATSHEVSLPPAQVVDMEAERRDLDRMVAGGDWQSLFD
jgi:hypothetical protein